MAARDLVLLLVIAATSASLVEQIVYKLVEGAQDVQSNGLLHQVIEQVDSALGGPSALKQAARYDPDNQNVYFLFTRHNYPSGQRLRMGNSDLLGLSDFNSGRRTAVLIHGYINDAVGWASLVNSVLVEAFLAAEDMNVIVVDWTAGSTGYYPVAILNTVTSGKAVARFIDWLNRKTGATPSQYHIVGHSLGAHQAGIAGRYVDGTIAYVTGLDPAGPGFVNNVNKFHPNDGAYTEVIHTNAERLGYPGPLAHVDFYPNGGKNMGGCGASICDHLRSVDYFVESLKSGGFWGTRCATYIDAMSGNCYQTRHQPGSLNMGGIKPKTGHTGIFYLQTKDRAPFSMG